MNEKQLQLNDDCEINITLPNNQWNTVVDWIAHTPYEEAKQILTTLNAQIADKVAKDASGTEFTGTLPIKTFNTLIFALGQAPYYVVAEIIQAIFTQGQHEINRLREQANAMKQTEDAPVEKTEGRPDNTPEEQSQPTTKPKTTRKRRTKKSE